ncbi:hypothetical protein [Acinetobacter tianfuensis]|uniref:Uncharacterized protein n=1 Tax=Acinetobacter tianfuensis TaxID=2419603 RepID=A0A3A8EEX0_9GAMM|nr:hypothetical protein [Acinetobacter tianfuensis]RKG29390.1 hypothetical protein D7V32_15185 [Acinetobacter tianfuensis]
MRNIKNIVENLKELSVHLSYGFLFVVATLFNAFMFYYSDLSNRSVFVITFIDLLFVFFYSTRWINSKISNISNEAFLDFLNFKKEKLYFTDISGFLGEQAFVSFLATFIIITGKRLLEIDGLLGGIYTGLLFIISMIFTSLSASRMILILVYLKWNKLVLMLLFLMLSAIMHIFYIIGLRIGASTSITWL